MSIHFFRSLKPRLIPLLTGLAVTVSSVGCTTAYDAYGRPVQTVDPAVAIAGVAAAGLIGYAIANDGGSKRKHHYRSGHRYGGHRYSRHDHGYRRGGYHHRPSRYGHRGGYCY